MQEPPPLRGDALDGASPRSVAFFAEHSGAAAFRGPALWGHCLSSRARAPVPCSLAEAHCPGRAWRRRRRRRRGCLLPVASTSTKAPPACGSPSARAPPQRACHVNTPYDTYKFLCTSTITSGENKYCSAPRMNSCVHNNHITVKKRARRALPIHRQVVSLSELRTGVVDDALLAFYVCLILHFVT